MLFHVEQSPSTLAQSAIKTAHLIENVLKPTFARAAARRAGPLRGARRGPTCAQVGRPHLRCGQLPRRTKLGALWQADI